MEIIPNKYKQKCELGACKNLAGYTVRFDRAGIRSRLHVCRNCLTELAKVSTATVKAIEKDEKKEKHSAV